MASGLAGGGGMACAFLPKVDYKAKVHIIDARRHETVFHDEQADGDHVKVQRKHHSQLPKH